MSGKAVRFHQILTQVAASRNASQAIIIRARIILLAFDKLDNQTVATDLQTGWVFVVDNLNTHSDAPLVQLIAKQLGINPASLGKVKRNGVLKTMMSQPEFLKDLSHWIRFVVSNPDMLVQCYRKSHNISWVWCFSW